VHVLIAAHMLHWWLAGRTLAPFVLSDTMHTLELGVVNPGFVLFGVAMLLAALFGRLLCGWACHMGALQDACAWLLKRVGLRPRPFRSRTLVWIPLLLGLYMFVWPTFKRSALIPTLHATWPAAAEVFGPAPEFPGFSSGFVTNDLWARLPGPAIAAPFLFICGCATVYFLGARGFCRYACPYGGLLRPAERAAP